MESIGAMIEGEWSSVSGIYNATEESDFMAHLINNCSVFSNDHQIGVDSCWSNKDESTMDLSSLHNFSNGYNGCSSNGTSSNYFPGFRHENGYFDSDSHQILGAFDESMTMGLYLGDEKIVGKSIHISETSDDMIDDDYCMINPEMNDDDCEIVGKKSLTDVNGVAKSSILKNKKRCLNSNDEKNKRNAKSKKSPNSSLDKNIKEKEKNVPLHRQNSSSCCSSEDYSNLSLDISEGMTSNISTKESLSLNSSGKTRASRGSATDPQSLYARKRRERINERLKVLQNLVPNGTKVDISTMLEEAVQYVKFLQLQIKLLSSDDHWMFAPLAYNGMDIGLDLKINMLNELRR